MFSLAAHATVGGLLVQYWRHAPLEPPQPLTVTLEVLPPVIVQSTPPPVAIKQATPAPKSRALPAPPVHHAPMPNLIAMQRPEVAPAAFAVPVPETLAAPVVMATAPAVVNPPSRADAVAPPHFNVAYLNNPRPAYPPIARKLGLEGVVLLRVDVSSNGTPEKIVIAQTSGASLLDEAAIKAVQGWTFVPARRGDTPIAHPVEVPIRFQLKN